MNDIYKALKKHATLKEESDIIKFEELLEKYIQNFTREKIKKLLDLFSDEGESHEVMWSLIHTIETYENEDEYICELLDWIKTKEHLFSEYIIILIIRILNERKAYERLKKCILIFKSKNLSRFLENVNNYSDIHDQQIQELRNLLN